MIVMVYLSLVRPSWVNKPPIGGYWLTKQTVLVGKFQITFDPRLGFDVYDSSPDYYGIKFTQDGNTYDVTCHIHLGERLVISGKISRDMPFHLGTASFLPKGVEVSVRRL